MDIQNLKITRIVHNNVVIEQDLDKPEQLFIKIQRMDDKLFYIKIRTIEIQDLIETLKAYENCLIGDFENGNLE